MGEPAGQEDPQEAPGHGALCPLVPARLHEGSAQPVHEEAQSAAAPRQEQVSGNNPGTLCLDTLLCPAIARCTKP